MKTVHLNAVIDSIALGGLLCLASTGLVLEYQLPPGSGELIGHGTGRGSMDRSIELLWGFTRHQWGAVHYWIALGLCALLSVHLLLHRKWIVGVMRGKSTGASGWRFALGLLALGIVTAATALPLIADTNAKTRRELQRQRLDTTNQAVDQQALPSQDPHH
jgi:Domain of unknown function (DUF4405)